MAFAAVFGKILGVVGGLAQGKAQFNENIARANKFGFDAQVAENNAELARQDQVLAAEAGAVERSNVTKAEQDVRGQGRTEFAAGNVRLDEGTPLEFDVAAAETAAAERERSKDNQAVRIQKLETEKQGLLAEATQLRRAKKRTKKSARLSQGGSILSTIGGAMGSK